MRIKKRLAFTLIEVLISLALTALLLTVLTSFYQQISYLDRKTEDLEATHFKLRYVENRLADVLLNVWSNYKSKEGALFFTSGDAQGLLAPGQPSLLFILYNGCDQNTEISNTALARLYLDKSHRLCVTFWQPDSHWPPSPTQSAKHEVLMEQVESIAFKFYVPPQRNISKLMKYLQHEKAKQKKQKEDEPIVKTPSPANSPEAVQEMKLLEGPGISGWVSEWPTSFQKLPAMIKIELTYKSDKKEAAPTTFVFPLPGSSELIVYDTN